MHENQQYAGGNDISDAEKIDVEKRFAIGGLPVGKLIANDGFRGEPSHKDARQHGTNRQHHLGRKIVAEFHQWLAQQLNIGIPHRQRTEDG